MLTTRSTVQSVGGRRQAEHAAQADQVQVLARETARQRRVLHTEERRAPVQDRLLLHQHRVAPQVEGETRQAHLLGPVMDEMLLFREKSRLLGPLVCFNDSFRESWFFVHGFS